MWSDKRIPALAFLILAGYAGASEHEMRSSALQLFPARNLYAPYVADPHRAGFSYQYAHYRRVAIPDSGDTRNILRLGGRIGLIGTSDWQLSMDAGYSGQFDLDRSTDNIGWDGIYGFTLAWRVRPDVAVKAGVMHWSSHVGDEYAERVGRRRINYTRGEYQLGVSWRPREHWRLYGDYGHAYDLRDRNLQRPDRAQAGVEYESSRFLWDGKLGWYAAMDVGAAEERDWRRDRAFQIGLTWNVDDRRWRFGIEHYRGRPGMGEFFQVTESYTALGLWMDL